MLTHFTSYTIQIFLFLFPLYLLPLKNQSIESDKQFLLVFFSTFLFLLTLLAKLQEKNLKIVRTPLDFLLIFWVLIYLFSAFLSSPNKIEALTAPLGGGTVLACVLLFFSLTHAPRFSLTPLFLSSALASLYLFFQQFRGAIKPESLPFLPLGNFLNNALFFFPVAVALGIFLIFSFLKKKRPSRFFSFSLLIAFLLNLGGFGLSLFHLATNFPPLILPFHFGWMILLEIYKNFSTFLLGVGPGNFSFAYTISKPPSLNLTLFWNLIPPVSSTSFFTLATEGGILSALVFLLIFLKVLKFPHNPRFLQETKPFFFPLVLILIFHFLFPPNLSLFILTFIFLALVSPKKEIILPLKKPFSFYILGLLALFSLPFFYFQTRSYLGDFFLRQALAAVNEQKGIEALNLLQKATRFNPYSDRSFNFSSNVSLSLAQSLTQSPESTQSAVQQQIFLLTQQAINHAQNATKLNPVNSNHWGNLANIYKSLIRSADGAEKFALENYQRQMNLDPNSPSPKVAAAQLLLSLAQLQAQDATAAAQNLSLAQALLTQAINLKPDWNNSHYQMGQFFKLIGRHQEALAELQKALNLTSAESPDYQQIKQEIETLQNLLSPPTPTPPKRK